MVVVVVVVQLDQLDLETIRYRYAVWTCFLFGDLAGKSKIPRLHIFPSAFTFNVTGNEVIRHRPLQISTNSARLATRVGRGCRPCLDAFVDHVGF